MRPTCPKTCRTLLGRRRKLILSADGSTWYCPTCDWDRPTVVRPASIRELVDNTARRMVEMHSVHHRYYDETTDRADPLVEMHTFTLVVTVAGGDLDEARAYLTSVLEVGDAEERIENVETHDEDLLSREETR